MEHTKLNIHQGFAYLNSEKTVGPEDQLNAALKLKDEQLRQLQRHLDSLQGFSQSGRQIYNEIKVQYPDLESVAVGPGTALKDDSVSAPVFLIALHFSKDKSTRQKNTLENWLQVRLQRKDISVTY